MSVHVSYHIKWSEYSEWISYQHHPKHPTWYMNSQILTYSPEKANRYRHKVKKLVELIPLAAAYPYKFCQNLSPCSYQCMREWLYESKFQMIPQAGPCSDYDEYENAAIHVMEHNRAASKHNINQQENFRLESNNMIPRYSLCWKWKETVAQDGIGRFLKTPASLTEEKKEAETGRDFKSDRFAHRRSLMLLTERSHQSTHPSRW